MTDQETTIFEQSKTIKTLQGIVSSLAERVAKQSELLSKKAEKPECENCCGDGVKMVGLSATGFEYEPCSVCKGTGLFDGHREDGSYGPVTCSCQSAKEPPEGHLLDAPEMCPSYYSLCQCDSCKAREKWAKEKTGLSAATVQQPAPKEYENFSALRGLEPGEYP